MLHIIKGACQYMQINPIQLKNQNNIINNYRAKDENIMQYFDYGVSAKNMKKRFDDLKNQSFERPELTKALIQLNQNWDAPPSTLGNIERLNDKNSVVVLGGQQAGLLTGPMYTVNKIISIIKYAKQQEEHLQVPVIPVFWIAGEDHDFDEINHIYMPSGDQMKKHVFPRHTIDKMPVSDISIQKDKLYKWLKNIFVHLQETQYTKDLYQTINDCLEQSNSYVDFFARLIFSLFQDEGLVLVDSGSEIVRRLENDHFTTLIHKQAEISTGVYGVWQDLKRCGYAVDLDLQPNNGHLYFYINNERILLNRTDSGYWIGKNDEIKLSTEELIEIAQNSPDRLSNNVISRPLMQELLFPTLAFIGGPGEISYWSTLKPAFNTLELKMPPVIPRLSMTYVDSYTFKLTEKYNLKLGEIIHKGVEEQKDHWLNEKIEPPVEEITMEIKNKIEAVHKPLRDIAHQLGDDLGSIGEKNLYFLHENIDFLEKRILNKIKAQYKQELSEFNKVNIMLHPFGGLQERVWNPLLFFNQFGKQFIKEVLSRPMSFDENHFLINL